MKRIFILIFLIFFITNKGYSQGGYLLKPFQVDTTDAVIGHLVTEQFLQESVKVFSDTHWVWLNPYYYSGAAGIYFRYDTLAKNLYDTAWCKAKLPAIKLGFGLALGTDSMKYPVKFHPDCTGTMKVLTESLTTFKDWVHFDLSDSLPPDIDGFYFVVRNNDADTALVDSLRKYNYDSKGYTR